MRRITLFYDGAWYTFKWLKYLLYTKDMFRQYGYDISFLNEEEYEHSHDKVEILKKDFENNEFDIVFLAFHDSHTGLCSLEKETFEEMMRGLRKNAKSIVWLDMGDSSGGVWKDAFPYVDKYLKKQICVDRSYYKKRNWGNRPYTDYYYRKGLIDSENEEISMPLSDEEINKIGLSWNWGLGDLFAEKVVSFKNPDYMTSWKQTLPESVRRYDVHFRGTYDYSFCGFQRNKCLDLLRTMKSIHINDMETRVNFEHYMNEISESKMVISPYGWGEICFRDFEAFINGAMLVKPDMSHIKTFPEWYVDDYTYRSIRWDFDNFKEVIEDSLNDDNKRIRIAKNAQDLFLLYRKNEGKRRFVEHIIFQINGL